MTMEPSVGSGLTGTNPTPEDLDLIKRKVTHDQISRLQNLIDSLNNTSLLQSISKRDIENLRRCIEDPKYSKLDNKLETILVENHDEQYESDNPEAARGSSAKKGELPTIKTVTSPKQASSSKARNSKRNMYRSI